MEIEYLGERFCQVLEEVKAIGNLRRLWRPLSRPVGIGFGSIARDDLDTRVRLEPLRHGVPLAVG